MRSVTTQAWAEEQAAAVGGPALICDTDAFTTPIWERRYLGPERARLDPAGLGRGDVYLLTHHVGVPFVQDGTRDGADLRMQMIHEFLAHLIAHDKPFAVLTGTVEQRVGLAELITDQAVWQRLAVAPPSEPGRPAIGRRPCVRRRTGGAPDHAAGRR